MQQQKTTKTKDATNHSNLYITNAKAKQVDCPPPKKHKAKASTKTPQQPRPK